jgi:hypothetical protein
VAKAFDTVWVDVLLFKSTALNFPSYLVKIISSYLHNRTFEAAFLTAASTRRYMRAGRTSLPCALPSYVNDMPVPFRHVEFTLYKDNTAVIATSRKSALFTRYLETYVSDLERWLTE